MNEYRDELLARFGVDVESADELEFACETAVRHGFPHGVSVRSNSAREDASLAARSAIELYFPVRKTGGSPRHFTVELPHPVTREVASRFNAIFGAEGVTMMSNVETGHGDTLLAALDPTRDLGLRIMAAEVLGSSDDVGVLEGLTRVAQQVDVAPSLAAAVGRSLAQIAFRRTTDIHELDLAMFSGDADDAYDAEIARLLRLSPNVEMRRAS